MLLIFGSGRLLVTTPAIDSFYCQYCNTQLAHGLGFGPKRLVRVTPVETGSIRTLLMFESAVIIL